MFDPGRMDMIMRLRQTGIPDTDVLRAMEMVPRKYFVPDTLWDKSYDDRALPIACGQTLPDPQTIAMMTQVLDAKRDHKVLEIGTGSGYHAAILSRLVTRVYSVERYQLLLTEAEARFKKCEITNIVTRHGDGRYGWKGQAPFDRIIITAGVKSVPKSLKSQLAANGVIVASIKGKLCRVRETDGAFAVEVVYPLHLQSIETGKSQSL